MKWFDEIIVGSQVQPDDPVLDGVSRGNYDYTIGFLFCLQFFEQIQSIAIWKSDIQQYAVIIKGFNHGESRFIILCRFAQVILSLKVGHHAFQQFWFIFYDQDFHPAILENIMKESEENLNPLKNHPNLNLP
jgi:hypothetical protein